MMHSYPTCDLRANCSQSSWDWSVLLQGCPADSEAIQSCNVSHLPPFALESLSSRSLELPHCSSTTFQWQSLFTTASQQVDISNCPLVCSCETAWVVNSHLEHLHVRLPRQFQCSPICPPAELDRQEKGAPVVGQFFQLEYRIIGQILPSSTINKTRQYFKWQGSRTGHSHREQIFDKLLRLEIFNVSEADVGVINIVCWHCVQPLFAYFEVRVPTPLSLQVETSDASSFRLAVQGYPVDKISLTVVDAKGENMTSDLSSTASTKFWKTMVVRPDSAHSLFHRRIFNIFTTSCTDCPEDHLAGDYTFTFFQEKELTLNDTGECKSISHHFNKFNASDLVHIQPNYEHRISLEPVVIVVLIFLTLFMAAAFINAKLHNIKSVGWRKWRWSFHSRLSRRTSHATEETMLRLEERLSLSSDYTGHVIPCIKGGAVQIHEQIGKGAFGAVYCGTWEQTGPRSVAVKALVEADAEVEKEATVLCRLDHDNIVRLYGLTRDGDRLLLVFEMMRLGDLRSYLKARAPQPGSYASFPAALDQSELKFIVRQVARGLCYLVAQQIVHRDLAARNCLVDGESDQMCGNPKQRPSISVKISDFGMSRRLSYNSDYYRMQNQSLLPVRWLPPEAISDHRFSSKSDIWSLGVTMWEIFSYGGVPFDTLSNHEVVSYALAGMRPPKPVSCPNDVYSLMERCWALDPEQRLTAEDVFLDPAVAESLEVGLL